MLYYTHKYKTNSGKWLKCYIESTDRLFGVWVMNENGWTVGMKRWNLKRIKKEEVL